MPTHYDQACRYAAKLDAPGLLCWLLGETRDELRFRTWLDTRTLPWPGDPERTCDTVAWLGDADPAVEWAVPVEFCLEPDGEMFGRLLIYLGRLWQEKRPTDGRGEHFAVGAVVVNLTGRGHASQTMTLRKTGVRTILQVAERNLADEDAATVLAAIATRTLSPCLLPWIALMRGADNSAIIAQWREIAGGQPPRRASDYAGLAVVLAEAAGRRELWKQALEGFNVKDSQQVLEWIAEGEAKGEARGEARGLLQGQADALLQVLARRFPPGASPQTESAVRATADLERLRTWLDTALAADSLEAFRQAAGL
jgi:hypothetical protein